MMNNEVSEDERVGRWAVTLTVLMGTISVVLTTTIVNVAIPAIMADFQMSQTQAQWLSTGFLAAMTATMLTSARLVERFGKRATFIGALTVFVGASLLAAASWSSEVMIFARVVQGAVAGVIQPLALIVIFQVFPNNERGKAIGLFGMGVVLAPALGPTLGGFLLDVFGWRSVYLAPLLFCLLGFIGARRNLSGGRTQVSGRFDWPGFVFLAVGLALLLSGLTALADHRGGLRVALFLGLGLASMALFLLRQWRARDKLVSLGVFRYPAFALSFILAFVYGAGLFASTYLLPLLVQGVQGMSATATGLVLMPAGLALAAVLPVSGRLSDHWPAYRMIISGLLVVAVGLFGLAGSGPATGFWILAGWILISRAGLGLILPAVNLDALRGLPEHLTQQGSGLINFSRQLGGALGVNLFALLLDIRVAHYIARDHGTGFDLHRFYDTGGGAAQAPPAALQALTRGFSDTFIVLGLVFVTAVIPAVAMGVYRGRISKDSAGLRR